MKLNNKTIIACVGIVTIGLVSYLLKVPEALWALFLLVFIIEDVED